MSELGVFSLSLFQQKVSRIDRQQQRLLLEVPADLPPYTTDLAALERVITELLDNAYKYTSSGETITVSAHAETDQVYLNVSNSGIEISASERSRIFDRFYRPSSPDP